MNRDEGSAVERAIARFGLAPHPEGGWFRRTWQDEAAPGARGRASSILYLLSANQVSRWHRIDATELWHHVAGAPLQLWRFVDGAAAISRQVLGPDLDDGELPQAMVAPREWQSARSLGAWSLVACVVVPEFTFEGFELAPEDWSPPVD